MLRSVNHRANAKAVYLSFGVNVLLFMLKIYAAIVSGSLAVIASAVDSMLGKLSARCVLSFSLAPR